MRQIAHPLGKLCLFLDTAQILQFRKLKVVGKKGPQTSRNIVHSLWESETVDV